MKWKETGWEHCSWRQWQQRLSTKTKEREWTTRDIEETRWEEGTAGRSIRRRSIENTGGSCWVEGRTLHRFVRNVGNGLSSRDEIETGLGYWVYGRTHTRTHTCTHKHIHTCTYIHAHTYTRMYTQSHILTLIHINHLGFPFLN